MILFYTLNYYLCRFTNNGKNNGKKIICLSYGNIYNM